MARLLITTSGIANPVIELHLGLNRFGRSRANDFPIDHATISARHCDLRLAAEGVTVCDCGSTNGTFIDGREIEREEALAAGQVLRLGEVELLVETTEVTIAIPKFDRPTPAPPVVLTDGSLVCPRHPQATVTHRCTHCREVLCDACVHHLRRAGGQTLELCPLCSHRCEPIGGQKPRKRSLVDFLQQTVKLPFVRRPRARR